MAAPQREVFKNFMTENWCIAVICCNLSWIAVRLSDGLPGMGQQTVTFDSESSLYSGGSGEPAYRGGLKS